MTLRERLRRWALRRWGGALEPWHSTDVAPATAARVLEMCGLDGHERRDARVLDFGCGSGRYMEVFASAVDPENVYGVEVDTHALAVARERGLQVEALDPDHAVLPFVDGSFDVVFTSNVIEHLPPAAYEPYLSEFFRVLRPGGTLAIGAPNYPVKRVFDLVSAWRQPELRAYYLFDDPTHINRRSILRVERDLRRVGFTEVRLLPTELPFERTLRLHRWPDLRYRLRWLTYKYFGAATRPGSLRGSVPSQEPR